MLQGGVCMTPEETTDDATDPAVIDGDVAVIANSAPDTDTVMRPVVGGFAIAYSRRGAGSPGSFGWDLDSADSNRDATLMPLSNGGVALVDEDSEVDENDGDVDVPPEPSVADGPWMLADPSAQLAWNEYMTALAADETGHDVIAVVPPAYAVGSGGSILTANVAITGSSLSVTAPSGSNALYLTVLRPHRNCKPQNPSTWQYYQGTAPGAGPILSYWWPLVKCVNLGGNGVFGKFKFIDNLPGSHGTLNGTFVLYLKHHDRVIAEGRRLVAERTPFETRTFPGKRWSGVRRYCAHLYQKVKYANGAYDIIPVPNVRRCVWWSADGSL